MKEIIKKVRQGLIEVDNAIHSEFNKQVDSLGSWDLLCHNVSLLEAVIAKQDSDSELLNAFDVKIMSSLGETYKHRDDICDLIERKDIPIRELIRQVELLDWIKNTTTGT